MKIIHSFALQVMTANIDGRALYPAFQFLPSRRRYPEYFNVIDQPIDLKTIAQKIQGCEYPTLSDLEKDLLLMVRNACHFNEPGSQIYKDSKMLKKVCDVTFIMFFSRHFKAIPMFYMHIKSLTTKLSGRHKRVGE